jgi:hypothetical protein
MREEGLWAGRALYGPSRPQPRAAVQRLHFRRPSFQRSISAWSFAEGSQQTLHDRMLLPAELPGMEFGETADDGGELWLGRVLGMREHRSAKAEGEGSVEAVTAVETETSGAPDPIAAAFKHPCRWPKQ